MANDHSAGSVSLELVIENTAKQQIESIAKQAVKPAEQSFKQVGATIEKAIAPRQSNVQKAVQGAWEKAAKQVKANPIRFEIGATDTDLLQQKLDNTYAQIGSVEEKLRAAEQVFNLTDDADVKNIRTLDVEMTALQAKLISLQSTANATEKKLNDALEAPARAAEKATARARKAAEKEYLAMQKSTEKAARQAQRAFERSYNQIIHQAQNAAAQASKWAIKAEQAQSKSAARAAKQAQKAYQKQERACRTYANKYADAQSDSGDKAAGAMEKAYRRMEKAAQKASGKAATASRKMAKDSSSGASKMGGAFGKMGKALKGSLKAVFVTAVLYKFFNAFKSHITGAMQQNKQFAKSLNAIKANLSVAFTPIIEAIMPMITRLAAGLATVTKYIASFIAAIFGKTYKQAVNSTKKLQSQAQKAKASTSRDFDELHNVDDDKDSSSDSGGVDYSALDTSELKTGPMQKFQEILDKIKTTIGKVKPAFKDFYEKGIQPVAKWIGEKLKDAFSFLGEQLGKVGDWFVEHKDTFSRLGESLGKLWAYLEPILDAAWDTLKTAIGGFIDSILAGLGSMFDLLPDVIDFVTAFLTGDWEGMKESGKNIIEGLWNGIKEQWELAKERIKKIFDGLIEIVKNIFGIHSPSTVFSDIGDNLIAGLWEGLKTRWEIFKTNFTELLDKLKTTVKEKFTKVKETVLSLLDTLKTSLKTKLEGVWDSLKGFINKVLGGVEKMINKPVEALNRFISKLNSLKVNIPDVLGGGSIGFNISPFNTVSIPKLAKGGIIGKPTLSLIGEAGKEAVVPLENNTGWMEKLSAMFGNTLAAILMPLLQGATAKQSGEQNGQVILNLDGQTVATLFVRLFGKFPQELNLVLGDD